MPKDDGATQKKSGGSWVSLNELSGEQVDFERLFNLLRAKAWLIFAVAAVIVAAAMIYVVRSPKIYESRALIQVEQSSQKVVNIAEVAQENPQTPDFVNTVVQALTSRKLLLRVVYACGLEKDPEFAPPRANGKPYSEIQLADRLAAKVSVQLRRGTRLVELEVEDQDPEKAQKIATSFIREFLRENFDQKIALSRVANEFLQEEAEKLKKKLEDSERKLQAYKEENKAVSLEDRQNIIVEKLRDLNTKVTDAKSKRLQLEADIEQLKRVEKGNLDELLSINSVSQLPQVALIREQLVASEVELAGLKERYLPKHPKYIAAATRIANLKQSLGSEANQAGETLGRLYEAAKESETKLDAALQEQEDKALELTKIAIPYNVLQRDVESDRALYESVTKRLKETAITQGVEQAPYRVIEEPMVASTPSKPKTKLILAAALFLGLAFGVAVVIALDFLDHSLRTVDEAESYLGLPSLTAIPDNRDASVSEQVTEAWKDKKLSNLPGALIEKRLVAPVRKKLGQNANSPEEIRHPLIFVEDPASLQAEAIRTLRTSLSLLGKQTERRTYLFASAIPQEGKSFTSLNFAHSLAQQGLRTVIIDADLRKPKLKNDLLPEAGDIVGLTDYLSGNSTVEEVVTKTPQENLFLLPAGHRAPNPAELLTEESFRTLLDTLLQKYDRVVVDSAPVNAVSDVLAIAACFHTTCLIVRAGKTPKKASLRAVKQLQKSGAHLAGFIFNRLPVGGRSAGYYYYYYGSEYSKDSVYGAKSA